MSDRIVFEAADGTVGVVIPAPGFTVEDCAKDVPKDALQSEVVNSADLNSDRTFRNAWVFDGRYAAKCRESVTLAKEICHDRRRVKRAEEFAPLDIKATIPAEAAAAETARVAVRAKHDKIQLDIDACTTPEELKAIIATEGI